MKDLDPFRLARELGTLAERCARSSRAIALGNADSDPFLGREWPGKTLFQQVEELDESDPLRLPLLRWIYGFVDERVQLGFRIHEGRLIHVDRHGIREPRDGQFTLAELSHLALTTTGAERYQFLRARARHEQALGAHRRELWARRAEVSRRLNLSHPDALSSPLDEHERLQELSWAFLDQTDEAARQLGVAGFSGFVEGLLASGASEGLPARLAPDTLSPLLSSRELLRGVSLAPFALPRRLAPSSFPLAFQRLGQAWAEALAPSDFPFVVARDAEALMARREGALFASWWRKSAFLKRRVGLSRPVAALSQRAFITAFLLEGRRRAARVLLRSAALAGQTELAREAPGLALRLFGEELEGEALLGRLELGEAAPQEFVALLSALVRDRELVEAYDEDYFDNPQAIERLRDEASGVPRLVFSADSLRPGPGLLLDEFAQAF